MNICTTCSFRINLDLVPEIELSSNDLLIDLARIGLGIAFIPDFCLSQTADSDSLFIVETKESLPERELVIAHNEKVPVSKTHRSFILFLICLHTLFLAKVSLENYRLAATFIYFRINTMWHMSLMVFFLSYCSIIYFSINNIFLILLTSYPSVLPFQNPAIFSSIFSLLQIWKSFHSLGNTSWHRRSAKTFIRTITLCPDQSRLVLPTVAPYSCPDTNKHNRIHSDSSGQNNTLKVPVPDTPAEVLSR